MSMLEIRDPIHGTVALSDCESALLDTPQMQRLRLVRQLAMAHLVYPGANHTRFEHSIGTLFLAGRICRQLGLPQAQSAQVRAAALLHDIGHPPFSHEAEAVLAPITGDHEKVGRSLLRSSEVADVLGRHFSGKDISGMEQSPLGQIISSDVGADRMDYLLRDSHYTGVAYGVIDAERICSTLSLSEKGLLVKESGLEAAESLLVARATMFSTVYFHKTVRIASRMLQEAIATAIADCSLEPENSFSLGDAGMLSEISKSPKAKPLVEMLLARRLYKKALGVPFTAAAKIGRERAEKELSSECGCPVLVDLPLPHAGAGVPLLKKDGKVEPLSDCSELVSSLARVQKSRLEALVVCRAADVQKVAAAASRLYS